MPQIKPVQADLFRLVKEYFCPDCKSTGTYFSVSLSTCPKCGSAKVQVSK